MKTRLLCIIAFLLFGQLSTFAQDSKPFKKDKGSLTMDEYGNVKVQSGNEDTRIGMNRNIAITDSSGTNYIPFTVSDESLLLKSFLTAKVQKGTLKITLLDPKGNTRGHININASVSKTNDNSWREQVEGTIEKQFVQPMSGEWKFKVNASNSTAQIAMKIIEN